MITHGRYSDNSDKPRASVPIPPRRKVGTSRGFDDSPEKVSEALPRQAAGYTWCRTSQTASTAAVVRLATRTAVR